MSAAISNLKAVPRRETEARGAAGALEALRDSVRAALAAGLTLSAAAREAGMSAPALSQWLAEKYPGDNAALEAKLERWLGAKARRVAASALIPPAPAYFDSPTASRIIAVLQYGQMAGDLVEIYGAPGVGKTRAAHWYRAHNPNVWIATMAPDCATPIAALEELCEAVDVRNPGQGARRMGRAIRRRLAETSGLLIVDEAQHLTVASLEVIRSIHDATGVGLCLMGSEVLHGRITGGNRAAQMAQIFSRIGRRLFIRRPTAGDLDAMLAAWSIRGAGQREFLAQLAATPGALRSVTKTIRLASAAAAASKAPLSRGHLEAAWRTLSAPEE